MRSMRVVCFSFWDGLFGRRTDSAAWRVGSTSKSFVLLIFFAIVWQISIDVSMRHLNLICNHKFVIFQTVKLVLICWFQQVSAHSFLLFWLFPLISLKTLFLPVVPILLNQPVISLHANYLRETSLSIWAWYQMSLKRQHGIIQRNLLVWLAIEFELPILSRLAAIFSVSSIKPIAHEITQGSAQGLLRIRVCTRHIYQRNFWSNVYAHDELRNNDSKWVNVLFDTGVLIPIRELKLAIRVPKVVVTVLILLHLLAYVPRFFDSSGRLIIGIQLTDSKLTIVRIRIVQRQQWKALHSIPTKLHILLYIWLCLLFSWVGVHLGTTQIQRQWLCHRILVLFSCWLFFIEKHFAILILMKHVLTHRYHIFKVVERLNVLSLRTLLGIFFIFWILMLFVGGDVYAFKKLEVIVDYCFRGSVMERCFWCILCCVSLSSQVLKTWLDAEAPLLFLEVGEERVIQL